MAGVPPLIATVALEAGAQRRLERERQRWYPRERNFNPAHLTLFAALPGEIEDCLLAAGAAVCAARKPFVMSASALRLTGRGVAYAILSDPLLRLREALRAAFATPLQGQDRLPFRPRVTIQNLVAPDVAQTTFARLEREFAPFSIEAQGVRFWRSRGGPWEALDAFGFGQSNVHRFRAPTLA